MKKILIVGQTPPPFHGQAISTKRMLDGNYHGVCLYHVRLDFSKSQEEIGRTSFLKVLKVFPVIFNCLYHRLIHQVKVMYYMPGGSGLVPLYRDFLILIPLRFIFTKIIFHFRSAGLSLKYPQLGKIEKFLFRLAYHQPDIAISLSELNPNDGAFLSSKKDMIIPNGMEDYAQEHLPFARSTSLIPKILYVGSMVQDKGIFDLLAAAAELKKQKIGFELAFVGVFHDANTEIEFFRQIENANLADNTIYLGLLTGKDKWEQFVKADLFCFPSYYENESFGNVIIEAMQFALPVVASNWRAAPSIVKDGMNGFIYEYGNSKELEEKLIWLLKDRKLMVNFGLRGREMYLKHYNVENYLRNFQKLFEAV